MTLPEGPLACPALKEEDEKICWVHKPYSSAERSSHFIGAKTPPSPPRRPPTASLPLACPASVRLQGGTVHAVLRGPPSLACLRLPPPRPTSPPQAGRAPIPADCGTTPCFAGWAALYRDPMGPPVKMEWCRVVQPWNLTALGVGTGRVGFVREDDESAACR